MQFVDWVRCQFRTFPRRFRILNLRQIGTVPFISLRINSTSNEFSADLNPKDVSHQLFWIDTVIEWIINMQLMIDDWMIRAHPKHWNQFRFKFKFGANLQNGGVEGNRWHFLQLEEHAAHRRPEAQTPRRTPNVRIRNIRSNGGQQQHHPHPPLHLPQQFYHRNFSKKFYFLCRVCFLSVTFHSFHFRRICCIFFFLS